MKGTTALCLAMHYLPVSLQDRKNNWQIAKRIGRWSGWIRTRIIYNARNRWSLAWR